MVGIKVLPLPDERLRIDFQFAESIKQLPSSFITEKPARLVLDFLHTKSELDDSLITKKIGLGSVIDYNIISVDKRIRVVLNLSSSIIFSGYSVGKSYVLTLSGKSHQLFKPREELFVTHQKINARSDITNIDFHGAGKQSGRLVIDVSSSSIPIEVKQMGKELVIIFTSTRVPDRLMKRYDVTDFQSPAQLITVQQVSKNTRVMILNKGDYGHFAYQVNKQFIVDVFPLSAEEIKQAKLKKLVYTGKLISLNFQNIPIRAVLQLLADFTGVNMVVSDDVTGNITWLE